MLYRLSCHGSHSLCIQFTNEEDDDDDYDDDDDDDDGLSCLKGSH